MENIRSEKLTDKMNQSFTIKHSILLMYLTIISFALSAQNYTINQGGTVITCNGVFLDAGGFGNYSNNENFNITEDSK